MSLHWTTLLWSGIAALCITIALIYALASLKRDSAERKRAESAFAAPRNPLARGATFHFTLPVGAALATS